MSPAAVQRKLAALLSADVVGCSRLMAVDEEGTVRRLQAYREIIDGLIASHHGRVFGTAGDSVIAEFASPVEAVRCAIEVQQRLELRNAELVEARRMRVRIGVNLCDVLVEADNLLGDGVNVAARLEGLAEPGGICISAPVYEQVRNKVEVGYDDLGARSVKNIPTPVHVYRVSSLASRDRRGGAGGGRRSTRVALAASLAIVALGSVVLWRSIDRDAPGSRSEPVLALPKGPSIAVLPFTNVSGDPDQEYFSDGLTEDIVTSLSKFEELFVIARYSTLQYKGRAASVPDIGRELGVRYVVEGSVRKVGQRVRVTAKLSDATDGRQLWGEAYDRDLTASDLFTVQDELTRSVVGAITGSSGALSRAGLADARRKTTENLDAYDCVLRTYEYLQVHTATNHLAARDCLERAVDLDPDYPDAWAWLAYTYAEEYRHQWNARPASLDRALEVANRAVGLDPANQVAHGVLAITYYGRAEFDRFAVEAEKAIALNPNNASWLALLGTYFAQMGSFDRGLPMVKKALAFNPNPPDWLYIPLFLDHYRNGRYAQALTEAQKITTEYQTYVFLAAAYGQLGRRAEARGAIDRLLALRPDFPAWLRDDHRRRGYPEELTDQLMEGLRKAGLDEQ